MKNFLLGLAFLSILHFSFFSYTLPDEFDFGELSATSRPIALQYMRGTNSQTGLMAGLYNHDTRSHRVSLRRGKYLKSASAGVQSMIIAKSGISMREGLLLFNTAFAGEWMSQRSKPVYVYELPPQQLTEIFINAVCGELHNDPPAASGYEFTVIDNPHAKTLAKIFAAVDSINLKIVPKIRRAIVSESGGMYTLRRALTNEERVILANLENFPDRDNVSEQKYLNFNALNWAVWAITDSLTGTEMESKMLDWSEGNAYAEEIAMQREMVKIILQKAGLPAYASRF